MDSLIGKKPEFGKILNAILDPIIRRAKTRKSTSKNTVQAQRNRSTVRNIRNIYTNTTAKKKWIHTFDSKLSNPNDPAAPIEWIPKKSKSTGKEYWYNPKTKESVWDPIKLPTKSNSQKAMEPKIEKAVAETLAKMPPPPPAVTLDPPKEEESTGKFPTLYSKSKGGKTQIWKIEVTKGPGEGATISVSYGYEGGAMQENKKEILKGKVKRSAWEQAVSEAQSDWKKKKDKGYAENLGNAHVPGVAQEQAVAAHKTILPMLAHDYHKRGKSIVFPAFVQAKLDGVRSVFHNGVLSSRMGKPFSGLEHITGELGPATEQGLILDGEVYSTTLPFSSSLGL